MAQVTVAQFAAFVAATGYQTTAEQQGFLWVYDGTMWTKAEGAGALEVHEGVAALMAADV